MFGTLQSRDPPLGIGDCIGQRRFYTTNVNLLLCVSSHNTSPSGFTHETTALADNVCSAATESAISGQ